MGPYEVNMITGMAGLWVLDCHAAICSGMYESGGPLSRHQVCMHCWPQCKKSPSWNILVAVPIEMLTRVSPLNHSCWDSKPISRPSLRAPHSLAIDAAVRHHHTSQVTAGRGYENGGAGMPRGIWLFKASSPVCCAQKVKSTASRRQRNGTSAASTDPNPRIRAIIQPLPQKSVREIGRNSERLSECRLKGHSLQP